MINDTDTVLFLITGGTIDSAYDGVLDTVVPNQSSVIPRYMKGVRAERALDFNEMCVKDSRLLTADDRAALVAEIESCDEKKIIVTHGIYTIPDTAQYLESHLRTTDKIVVLTGSSLPLDGFTMSDAGFNLGFALAMIDVLQPGVHICRNGRVFTPTEVAALLEQGHLTSFFGRVDP